MPRQSNPRPRAYVRKYLREVFPDPKRDNFSRHSEMAKLSQQIEARESALAEMKLKFREQLKEL